MTPITAILIIVALVVGWTLLKVFLRLTMRLFACGCVAIAALVGVAWLIIEVL